MGGCRGVGDQVAVCLWERQDAESLKAFEAFACYRDMGEERSYVKVAEQLRKSAQLIGRWGRAYGWKDRIAAYERQLDRQAQELQQEEITKMRMRQREYARAMQKKGMEFINSLKFDPGEGDTLSSARLSEIVSLLKAATELERVSMGDAGEAAGAGGGEALPAVRIYIPDNRRDSGEWEEGRARPRSFT